VHAPIGALTFDLAVCAVLIGPVLRTPRHSSEACAVCRGSPRSDCGGALSPFSLFSFGSPCAEFGSRGLFQLRPIVADAPLAPTPIVAARHPRALRSQPCPAPPPPLPSCTPRPQPDKRYQLADWRLRPLPPDMLHYARCDTHYLLHVYDRLRQQLREMPDDRVGGWGRGLVRLTAPRSWCG
jgi:hypothetical protein